MIQVDEKETIRKLDFIKRHSIRRIAREHHYSRKMIRKAIINDLDKWRLGEGISEREAPAPNQN